MGLIDIIQPLSTDPSSDVNKSQQHQEKKFWECLELNPQQLGEKQVLCSPLIKIFFASRLRLFWHCDVHIAIVILLNFVHIVIVLLYCKLLLQLNVLPESILLLYDPKIINCWTKTHNKSSFQNSALGRCVKIICLGNFSSANRWLTCLVYRKFPLQRKISRSFLECSISRLYPRKIK